VAVKITSFKKLHVTVMLCITADGNKLPAFVILNRKTVAEEKFCLKNACITSELMEVWLKYIWEHRPGVLSEPQNMPSMDAFCGHLSDRLRNR
jgi:hypothetical protein